MPSRSQEETSSDPILTMVTMMEDPHAQPIEKVLRHYQVGSLEDGLSEEEAQIRLKVHGHNELPPKAATPLWRRILAQFNDQLVQILLAAAVVSFLLACLEETVSLEAFVEPLVILAILAANATVGVVQEGSAERAIAALKSYVAEEASVIRSGQARRLAARDLVPGDVVELAVGDRVPADVRVAKLQSSSLRVNQSLLTGESESVEKQTAVVEQAGAVKQEQSNLLFSGTMVCQGRAVGVVVRTGCHTALGAIQLSLSSSDGDGEESTPLQKRLDEFGSQLARLIGAICVLVWLVNVRLWFHPVHGSWWRGALYYFKIAVALAVAAIPEGLAVIITTCLALGTRRMAKAQAIVRTLPSVETLGCTTCICSDKTGTLTTNQMAVTRVISLEASEGESQGTQVIRETAVSGTTYDPQDGQVEDASLITAPLSMIAALCNDARLINKNPNGNDGNIWGEPTEAALLTLVEKVEAGAVQRLRSLHPRLLTVDFDRTRKRMSVICRDGGEGREGWLLCKGAPESVMAQCVAVPAGLGERVQDLGASGLRVLALAYRRIPSHLLNEHQVGDQVESSLDLLALEQDLTLAGLVAMR